MDYHYVSNIDSIGSVIVSLYEEQISGHKIAVKFDKSARSQNINNEEINLKKIKAKNANLLHVVNLLGSHVLPIAHTKFEYIS